MSARAAWTTVLGGMLLAGFAAVGVVASDGPHLSLDSLDPWIVLYAIGLAIALGALPFALHERMSMRTEDRDRRWELALMAWGGIALLAGLGFLLLGLALGFDSADASGALAIVGLGACGLVVGALAVLLLST